MKFGDTSMQSLRVEKFCSERELESENGTPRQSDLPEFKDVLISLVQLCRAGSVASSSALSQKDGSCYSRSQSMVSDDYSCVPPEEPEWLSKMASRALHNSGSARSHLGSRQSSSVLVSKPSGVTLPSPLRHSTHAAHAVGEEPFITGSDAPSPRSVLDKAHQALYDRFGSLEVLSAAVDDFYHRLCGDERIGQGIREVPEQDVRYLMMQLMALSLQQQQHQNTAQQQQQQEQEQQQQAAAARSAGTEERQLWLRQCHSLLTRAGAGEVLEAADTAAVYDTVIAHMLATLEQLGLGGAEQNQGSNLDGALSSAE